MYLVIPGLYVHTYIRRLDIRMHEALLQKDGGAGLPRALEVLQCIHSPPHAVYTDLRTITATSCGTTVSLIHFDLG